MMIQKVALRTGAFSSLLLLGFCQTAVMSSGCPTLVQYDRAFLSRVASQYSALPHGSELKEMITDYSKLRDACRVQ